jgi:hypothetical protein
MEGMRRSLGVGSMHTPDELFEQYTALRLQGQSEDEAQRSLLYGIQTLALGSQVSLKQRFQAWEEETSSRDFEIQARLNLANSTTEIILCPVCESPNHISLKDCQICGAALLPDLHHNAEYELTSLLHESFWVILASLQSQKQIRLQPQKTAVGLRLGRHDPELSIDVDLSAFTDIDLGISRVHALLEYDSLDQLIYLSDLNSRNGSFVNERRLEPEKPMRLRDGDTLRFGHLSLSFHIEAL